MPLRTPNPRLILEVYDNETTYFGPDTRACIISDAAKVGWSAWSRFPPSAYFTLRKSSPYNELLTAGLSHLRMWYVNAFTGYGPELVFTGRIGDADESRDDVVWRAHGYLAELALSRTGYRVMYGGKRLSNPVWKEYAKDAASGKFKNYGASKQGKGLMRHIPVGDIQCPKNANDVRMKLEAGFGVIDTPRLLFFYDLSEIGRANTSFNVTFEVSRSTSPVFNFWRDRGTDLDGIAFTNPGNIRDYRFVRGVTDIRNDLASIGSRKGQAREIVATQTDGAYGINTFGRRQDTFPIRTLAGFRNLDTDSQKFSAQKMIIQRAVKEASRPTRELVLDIPYGRLEPFDGWDIEDTVPVRIKDGRTDIDDRYRIVGATGTLDETGYRQGLYVVTETS